MLSPTDLARLNLSDVIGQRPLAGGRNGRTFRVDTTDESFVVHRRGPADGAVDAVAVRREAKATRGAFDVGVGPEVVAVDAPHGLLLTRWIPGHSLAPRDLIGTERIDRVAAMLRRLHGADGPNRALDPIADRLTYLTALSQRGGALPAPAARVTHAVDAMADALRAHPGPAVMCHGDLVAANVILHRSDVHLVDFEYAGRHEPAFDLGNLVATAPMSANGVRRLVRSYAAADGTTDIALSEDALLARVRAWAVVARHAWIAWVALGDDLGPQEAVWRAWSTRAAVSLDAAARRGTLDALRSEVQRRA